MAEQISIAECPSSKSTTTVSRRRSLWPSVLRWIPTSTDHILASEKRLLSLVKTSYVQEHVNIGSGPPGSKIRWFRSSSNSPSFINAVTFDSKKGAPILGFSFKSFDYLAEHFQVIAIDQLGQASFFTFLSSWGGSSRPNLHAKAVKVKTEAWFVDSFEERRRVKNLSNLIILGHSFGGYIASKYALKHPEHVQHLILVGPAGFSSESDSSIEWLTRLRETWKGAILNRLWESNFTTRKIVRFVYLVQFSKPTTRNQGQLLHIALDWSAKTISLENYSLNASSKGLGPWGPKIVHKYTATRFNPKDSAEFVLAEEQNKLLTDYAYHISAAKASGELCLKHIFSFGALPRMPLPKRLGYTA
ncbi:Alpha/beta-Hydrolases superfamily protein isoform 1 [Gossypium australe]|uniref:Alpha/beta-Hydrolases superfamily protein isoform 1 n=1 Tax=Gossypium australe TaxID=47621 RepID=A0A5B6UAU4_9ROSI|nr:Alpha/beta-Hydrolases superfamily protein isoform 1 [Gossypium australe]